MKTVLNLYFGLAAAGMLGIVSVPAAAGANLQMIVVAERADANTSPVLPTPQQPAYYVAFDGGYVEAGDPIANEQPPATSAITQSLRLTLAGRGYEPAADTNAPSVVLIYHWGMLNRDSYAFRHGNQIDPNLHARLSLVSTNKQDEDVEQYLVERQVMGRKIPDTLDFHQREILQTANDNRYFVIVSAYDCAAVGRHEPKLLWRTKMSAYGAGIAMADALPTLLQGGAPYFGRNLKDFEYIESPVVSGGRGGQEAPQFAPPLGNPGSLDAQFLLGLMKQEHDEFSGTRPSDKTPYDPIVSASPAGTPSSSTTPPQTK